MRRLILLYALLAASFVSGAQSIDELKTIQAKTKNAFITPDALDGLMNSLRQYESNPVPGQDSIMFDIYKTASASYVANNHFKQGYLVFNRYLEYKEKVLADHKASELNRAFNSVAERSRNDETELLKLQNQLSELKAGNDKLSHRLVMYKSNFTLTMIFLSIIFAVILVGYGIRVFSLRSRLNYNRRTMKDIHKFALTGRYEEGVRNALQKSIADVDKEIADLKAMKI